MKKLCYGGWLLLGLAVVSPLRASAETRTWNGPATGDWFTAVNWTPSDNYPQAGDTVVIATGSALLTNETAELAAFSITNATLVFSNWTTRLRATTVNIWSNGILTLPGAFTEAQMSNRVWVVCTNLTMDVNGGINVNAKGYAGGSGAGVSGSGPGGGGNGAGGACGGRGANSSWGTGGSPYGSTNEPIAPGSGGGGGGGGAGKAGGGAVRIEASGAVAVNGTITANGGAGGGDVGGGAGGSIYINCGAFSGGTNGALSANGSSTSYGGGGGGRIALICNNIVRENVKVRFSTKGGIPGQGTSGMGTVYLSSSNLLSETLDLFDGVRLLIPDFTEWTVTNLSVSNRVVSLGPLDGGAIKLTVVSDLVITNGGLSLGGEALAKGVTANLAGPASNPVVKVFGNMRLLGGGVLNLGVNGRGSNIVLTVGTNVLVDGSGSALALGGPNQAPQSLISIGNALTLTNGGSLTVYAGVTNSATTNYGALVTVLGVVSVASNCWIYPYSQGTNGGSVLFRVASLTIAGSPNGGINADAKGYAGGSGAGVSGSGPGGGGNGAGGGYGGRGANSSWGTGGSPYGSTNEPIDAGSGGGGSGSGPGQAGGGAVWIEASGDMAVNGMITANGGAGGGNVGGGAGGGIHIICGGAFSGGANGVLSANGSSTGYGGGGGGRIAVWVGVSDTLRELYLAGTTNKVVRDTTNEFYSGSITVNAGTGGSPAAEAGTKFFFTPQPVGGTVFTLF